MLRANVHLAFFARRYGPLLRAPYGTRPRRVPLPRRNGAGPHTPAPPLPPSDATRYEHSSGWFSPFFTGFLAGRATSDLARTHHMTYDAPGPTARDDEDANKENTEDTTAPDEDGSDDIN
jgi:hypothetical protein